MGLSSITDKQREAAWRVEFQALGEQLVFENVKQGAIYNDEAKRQAALRWLSERDRLAQLAWGAFFCGDCGGAYQHHWLISGSPLSNPRHFPPPWSVETRTEPWNTATSKGLGRLGSAVIYAHQPHTRRME